MWSMCVATAKHAVFSGRTIGKGTHNFIFTIIMWMMNSVDRLLEKTYSLHILDQIVKIKTLESRMPNLKLTQIIKNISIYVFVYKWCLHKLTFANIVHHEPPLLFGLSPRSHCNSTYAFFVRLSKILAFVDHDYTILRDAIYLLIVRRQSISCGLAKSNIFLVSGHHFVSNSEFTFRVYAFESIDLYV